MEAKSYLKMTLLKTFLWRGIDFMSGILKTRLLTWRFDSWEMLPRGDVTVLCGLDVTGGDVRAVTSLCLSHM